MSSIVYCEKNPEKWIVFNNCETLKETGEPLYEVKYGSIDDDPEPLPLIIHMRKSVYENVVNGLYRVDYDYATATIALYEKKTGDRIPKVASSIY